MKSLLTVTGAWWRNWKAARANAERLERCGADEVRRIAGDNAIFVVWKAEYLTFDHQCEQFLHQVGQGRSFQNLVTQDSGKFYEPSNLTWLAGP